MTAAAVDVAAGVLIQGDGQVLLAQRPVAKVYAGYWEFPGGKVEPGETPRVALDRELHEELGIRVTCAYPWLTQVFEYSHATVRIYFYRVTSWDGIMVAREHQALEWQRPEQMTLAPMLPANTPLLRALDIATEYAISNVTEVGEHAFLKALEWRLSRGLRLVQLREKMPDRAALRAFGQKVLALCRTHGARLLVNADMQVAQEIGADGIHLSGPQLARLEERPHFAWVGATCHDEGELAKAASLALDFVVLGPVVEAATDKDRVAMGWRRFSRLIENYPLPVFAVGGLTRAYLETAWTHGAHGIAARRAAWREPN
ncbi:MAG: Nudix family hydrolase [Betaproteobacteria bacterium]|nr:Nudix family hydrolase [Betaproteobacteria bacterium]